MTETSASGAQVVGVLKNVLTNAQVLVSNCLMTGTFNSASNKNCTFGIDQAAAGATITILNMQMLNIVYSASDFSSLILNYGTNITVAIQTVSVTGSITLMNSTTT